MTREERELQDVDRQMEEQLIQEHMQASAALRLLSPCWFCAVGQSELCVHLQQAPEALLWLQWCFVSMLHGVHDMALMSGAHMGSKAGLFVG